MKMQIIGDEIDYRHDMLLGDTIRATYPRPQGLNAIPWVLGRMTEGPITLHEIGWWNNVSLANTTQDGV